MITSPIEVSADRSYSQRMDDSETAFFICPNGSYNSALKGTLGFSVMIGESGIGLESMGSYGGLIFQSEFGLGGSMMNIGFGTYLGDSRLGILMLPPVWAISGVFSYLKTNDDPLNATRNSKYYGGVLGFTLFARATVGVYVKDYGGPEQSTLFTASLGFGL